MKIGLDVHGCIDSYPDIFSKFSKNLVDKGHEVHIITGRGWDIAEGEVKRLGMSYTHHFSIVDYHKSLNTPMWRNEKQGWEMDASTWNRSKGDYIWKNGIDIHFDNDHEYVNWMPDSCTVILVPENPDFNYNNRSTQFHKFVELIKLI